MDLQFVNRRKSKHILVGCNKLYYCLLWEKGKEKTGEDPYCLLNTGRIINNRDNKKKIVNKLSGRKLDLLWACDPSETGRQILKATEMKDWT